MRIFWTLLFLFPTLAMAEENSMEKYMKMFGTDFTTGSVTPTVCDLCGVPRPDVCVAPPVQPVLDLAAGKKMDKVLIFCSDAIGDVLFRDYPEDFAPLVKASHFRARCSNVMVSVTPVNFATIFTGAPPEVHGIKVYSKPILKVQTFFDVFPAAGKKTALVAAKGSSMDSIFKERNVTYFSAPSNADAFEKTKEWLQSGEYDVIVCYDGGYDSTMHATGTRSEASLAAMRLSIQRYLELLPQVDSQWKGKNYVTVFISDHGSHDNAQGKGTHGTETAEDMIVNHFYRGTF